MRSYWSSRLSEIVAILLAMSPILALAQFSRPDEKPPKDGERYLYPINPGQPGSLAGTMGELRTTHFHSGIDIRTNNQIGYAVLASKSGYISRVTVSPGGYGNVIYITHPDGNTTLYAHLDKFKGKIAKHVLSEQYKQKEHAIDLFFQENEFKVKRGDTIALSGNSGSSGGPHLHFDIRDPNNFALNPLQVEGFPEIVDDQAPAVEKVALKTLDANSRINDKFGRFEFYAQRVGKDYVFPVPIFARGNIGVEILAKDRLAPRSQFYGGVNYIEVTVDDKKIFKQAIDKINIAETRGIYTLMDFKTMRLTGNRFYKLYIDDGNDLDFYGESPSHGKIAVTDKDAAVSVWLKDSYGNASTISLNLKPSPATDYVRFLEPLKGDFDYDVVDNTIVLSTKVCDSAGVKVYSRTGVKSLKASYGNEKKLVYLIDLRKTLPDSITFCDQSIVTNLKTAVLPGHEYNYYSDPIDVEFPAGAAYDTVYLTTYHGHENGEEVFNIGSRVTPLSKAINVTLRPDAKYSWDKTYAVYRKSGGGYAYLGGGWENGGVHFATREFGDFVILQDLEAPTIKPVAVNNYIARFKIRDNLSGINKYEANIDGNWLLMHYDPKTASIWSEQLDKSKPLKGKLTVVVTDNAGNETTYTKIIP